MENNTRIIPVRLPNGYEIRVEATNLGGESEVGVGNIFTFTPVVESIESIAEQLLKVFDTVKPNKATFEFGIEFGVESGTITAFLVKGTGNANIKISLEWAENRK